MTIFETIIHDKLKKINKYTETAICTSITDARSNETFCANLNAISLYDVDYILMGIGTVDVVKTLQNHFDKKLVEKYAFTLKDSHYIFYTDFKTLLDGGFEKYIDFLEKNLRSQANRMDNAVKKQLSITQKNMRKRNLAL